MLQLKIVDQIVEATGFVGILSVAEKYDFAERIKILRADGEKFMNADDLGTKSMQSLFLEKKYNDIIWDSIVSLIAKNRTVYNELFKSIV
jgi:hypothetical protein